MKNRYRNLWHKDLNVPKPPLYQNNAPLALNYRGVTVYHVASAYDYVYQGACIACRAGCGRDTIDSILDGRAPVGPRVHAFLTECGLRPMSYDDFSAQEDEKAEAVES